MGRSRGGLTSKIHALVDARGRPVKLILTPGQRADAPVAADLLDGIDPGATLLADKADDTNAIRAALDGKDGWANIPAKATRKDSWSNACRIAAATPWALRIQWTRHLTRLPRRALRPLCASLITSLCRRARELSGRARRPSRRFLPRTCRARAR